MKDYRPLLSEILNFLEEVQDSAAIEALSDIDPEYGGFKFSYTPQELETLVARTNDMFNEIDYEVEGGERF